jgi:hypothetical protein
MKTRINIPLALLATALAGSGATKQINELLTTNVFNAADVLAIENDIGGAVWKTKSITRGDFVTALGLEVGVNVQAAANVNAGSVIVTNTLRFETGARFPDNNLTNFVMDLDLAERYLDATNDIHVIHSTNRVDRVSSVGWTIWTGETNRILTCNASWRTNGLPVLLTSNKMYRLTVMDTYRGGSSETNVIAALISID